MCGIYGSTELKIYSKLQSENKDRGTFAIGSMFYSNTTGIYMRKTEGDYTINDSLDLLDADEKYQFYMGHVQAPTGSFQKWSASTSHPFDVENWVVAHNGVLENNTTLKEKYNLKYSNPVDTYVIPALLNDRYVGDDVYCIQEVFSEIRGTFACWLFSKHTNKFYVVRSGSTLFCDRVVPSISSVKTNQTPEEFPEGEIYEMSIEGLLPVGEFETHNPFFIL